ncbi:MAG TPA: hypothetical protein VME47_19660 [Acetobacteraceae bacterium]|nr:hypothetical protein [Acetobacteraceae bacterium]
MHKLLLAAAMAAGLAAPAFAQSAATSQPGSDQSGTPSVQAQNVPLDAPAVAAPSAAAEQLGVPGPANSRLGADQAYQAGLGNPHDWKVSNPNNFDISGG